MLRFILKNPPKTFLTPQGYTTGKMNKVWHPVGSRIPRELTRGANNAIMQAGKSCFKTQNSIYIFGLVGAAAVASAVNFADMADGSSDNKIKRHHINQVQLQESYDILKREMGLPLDKNKMDDWDQLIFVVKTAINIKKCKEELAKMRKTEEILLQESMASDQTMRQRADETFKKREQELIEQYSKDFQLQVAEETAHSNEKLKQMSKELKDTAIIELEHDINMQKALMAKEMMDKFDQFRAKNEKCAEKVETILNSKHCDLNEQEAVLKENKYLVNVRDKCREVEAELMTEMTPEKKWVDQMCSLTSLVETVMHAFPENDELANAVLESLPIEVVERGIFTEVALKQRFDRVERIAQRLALLRNEGPYPGIMYFASYLRSMLILKPRDNPAAQPEMLSDIDNTDILYQAKNCVERGDFVRAVKFLEHLQGASRNVVSGWIQEAHLVMQVRMATQVLKNYATLLIQRSS